jgi:hypothetical protein
MVKDESGSSQPTRKEDEKDSGNLGVTLTSTFATILIVMALAFVLLAFFKQKLCFAPKNVSPGIVKPKKSIRESLGFRRLRESMRTNRQRQSMKIEPMTVKIITKQFQNLDTENRKMPSKPLPPLPSTVEVHQVEEKRSPNLPQKFKPKLPTPSNPSPGPIPLLNKENIRKFEYVEKNPSPQPSPKFIPKPVVPDPAWRPVASNPGLRSVPSPTFKPVSQHPAASTPELRSVPSPLFKPVSQQPAAPKPGLRSVPSPTFKPVSQQPAAPKPGLGSADVAQGSLVREIKRNLEKSNLT